MQFNALVSALRAAAEPTRLRLLRLCAEGELSVGELTQILGQSQPRVSRHLKLMVDAGLLKRFREGVQVFYRVESLPIVTIVLGELSPDDRVLEHDFAQLEGIRRQRAQRAQRYFDEHAAQWDALHGLDVPAEQLRRALLDALNERTASQDPPRLLDLGTGTGQVLDWLAEHIASGVGVDLNTSMLALARARLTGHPHLSVRAADLFQLPFDDASYDLAVMHMVLHFIDQPARALREARRVLAPGGRLLIVDFAPHSMESLREEHEHRWLGFADEPIGHYAAQAGLRLVSAKRLVEAPLAVTLWRCDVVNVGE